MNLTEQQIERYSRNIIVKDIGVSGQIKLLKSKIIVIGVGGLGSSISLYLAAAGIGTLGIVDNDNVDITNLQRQIIHWTKDLNRQKVISAKEKIESLNPDVKVIPYKERIDKNNIFDIIKDYDFIIDATDNFNAKFLINDACVLLEKPYSHAGVLAFEGQTLTYIPNSTCYRCIFNTLPPKDCIQTSSQVGIIGAVAGTIGAIQAIEAIKYITGAGELLINRLFIFNAKSMHTRILKLNKNKNCPVCGDNPIIKDLNDYELDI